MADPTSDERGPSLAQLTLDAAPDPICWVRADGRFAYANPAACAALEYSRQELLELSVPDVSPEVAAANWPARWARLRAAGRLRFFAERRTRSGLRTLVEVTATHLVHGGEEYAVVHSRDAGEDLRARGALLESRDHPDAVFHESPTAIALIRTADGAFLDVNACFEGLLGIPRSDLIGRESSAASLWAPGEWGRLVAAVRENGAARDLELRLRRGDGALLETLTSAVPLASRGQECLLTTVADVTRQKAAERELREREERLRIVFETSQAGIILVDPAGIITFANRRMAEMFGCGLEELIGSSYPEHLHPDERRVGDERMRRLIAAEIDHVYTERRYLRRDGSSFWGYLSGRRHEDADGKLVSLVGVIADISDRKRAERAIRDSEARYRGLIELAADAVLQGDPSGTIIGANASAVTLTGYPADELVGMNIARLFSEAERRRAPLRYDLLQRGETVRMERVLTRRDGSGTPVEMNSKMMPDGSYQTFVRDVGERRKAEDVLRASEEKFATAFQRAPLLMTISRWEDGRYLDVNETFCRVSGFSREEALGRTSVELGWVSARDRQRLLRELEERGRVKDLELVLTAKGGREVHCVFSGEPVTIEGSRRLLSIALDVTEKRRLQEELVSAQRLESLGVLAGGLAHDFNNILTGILGNLSLGRLLLGPEHRAAERLVECEKAAVRASQLTQQLLTFARGGAPVKRAVEIAPLVREAVSFSLHGSSVRGAVELPDGLPRLHADEGQVSQVLQNLLINAAQAMPSGGTVTVRGESVDLAQDSGLPLSPGPYVRLTVTDTGGGIPRELLGKVFDPYFTTKPGGTGLGLSSVYSIVKRHGGCVQVSSSPGRGTTFTLHLPAAASPDPARDAPAPEEPPVLAGSGRVLVMDDEEMIRDLAATTLEALGYVVVSCADGEAAVTLYRQAREEGTPFTTAILDLTIPGGVGGREAAARILALDPEAVLLVSSGYSNDPVLADFRSFGFSGAVVKPYSISTLARELDRLAPTRPRVER